MAADYGKAIVSCLSVDCGLELLYGRKSGEVGVSGVGDCSRFGSPFGTVRDCPWLPTSLAGAGRFVWTAERVAVVLVAVGEAVPLV